MRFFHLSFSVFGSFCFFLTLIPPAAWSIFFLKLNLYLKLCIFHYFSERSKISWHGTVKGTVSRDFQHLKKKKSTRASTASRNCSFSRRCLGKTCVRVRGQRLRQHSQRLLGHRISLVNDYTGTVWFHGVINEYADLDTENFEGLIQILREKRY